ncbi:MAG: hypothetical protein CM15mP106_1100 [Candidatus Neomarinimicrobiota bacterium]|nr:MAG: hypothetical protein CM15mP106_1100 [Candidatus Neomarinimicrobiota bacterium]
MTIIYGTENNDTIDATYSNGTSWGDSVKAGEGNDTVRLGPGVSYFSGLVMIPLLLIIKAHTLVL